MALKENEKILLEVDIRIGDLTAKAVEARKSITLIKEENKKLNKEAAEALKNGATASYQQLTETIVQNEATLRDLQREQRNTQKTQDLISRSNNAAEGSYEKLLTQQSLAQTKLKLLEGTLEKNSQGNIVLTEAYKKQAIEVKKAKDAIIAFDQGISDGRSNVGNYTASILDAAEKSGLFGEATKLIKDGLAGVKTTADIAKQGVELVEQGLTSATDAFKNFFTVTKANDDLPETFTFTTKAVEETTVATEAATLATEEYGVVTEVATGSAVVGFTAVRVAIAATGIGLLLIAVASLIAFFKKNEAAAEALERVFAGLGSVVDLIVNGLAGLGSILVDVFSNPKQALIDFANLIKDQVLNRLTAAFTIAQGLANLDFKKAADGVIQLGTGVKDGTDKFLGAKKAIGEYADKVAAAAAEGARLEGLQQELNDRIRQGSVEINNNNNTISKALKLSKDATISLADRKAALKAAGEAEARNAQLNEEFAQKQFDIDIQKIVSTTELSKTEKKRFAELVSSQKTLDEAQQKELDNLQNIGQVSDAQLQTLVDSNNKKNNVVSEAAETRLLIQKRENKFAQDELKKDIAANVGILEAGLKERELQGIKDFNLQRDIAKKTTQETLLNEELTSKERQRIRAEGALKLAEINKAESDFKKDLQEQTEDALLSGIIDARAREITEESLSLKRKLEAIKGNSDEEVALRTALIEQSALKVQEIESRSAEENLSKTIALEQKKSDLQFKAIDDYYSEKQAKVEIAFQNEEMTAKEFADQTLQIEQERLASQLTLLEDQKATRLNIIDSTYQSEQELLQAKLDAGLISQQAFADQTVALETEKNASILAVNDEFAPQLQAQQEAIGAKSVEITQKTNKQILDDIKTRKKAEALANQQSAEQIGDFVGQVKGFLQQSAKDHKDYGVLIKALSVAELAVNLQKELSSISLIAANTGAAAGPAGVPVSAATLSTLTALAITRFGLGAATILAQKFEHGGPTKMGGEPIPLDLVMDLYKPNIVDTFSEGMSVLTPTLGLIGEKGAEEVFPNWMLKDQVSGPVIKQLASYRQSGRTVLPFVDGGITSTSLPNFTPLPGVASAEDIARALSGVKIVTHVEDIVDAVDRKNLVESRADN